LEQKRVEMPNILKEKEGEEGKRRPELSQNRHYVKEKTERGMGGI